MNFLSINNISFKYENKTIFDGFSKKFPEGELSVIMSPSGSGKTTLLYLIAGLLSPDSGTITYPCPSPRFSMVFQDNRLIDGISVAHNIKLANPSLSGDDINEALKALKLNDLSHKRVCNLSGGEKQRVSITRAILADYDILLLDEPFTGIDDDNKLAVVDYLKKRTAGKTVLLVTHDKSEAALCGGSISYLDGCLIDI